MWMADIAGSVSLSDHAGGEPSINLLDCVSTERWCWISFQDSFAFQDRNSPTMWIETGFVTEAGH